MEGCGLWHFEQWVNNVRFTCQGHTHAVLSLQDVNSYLEYLTLRAIYEAYIGNRTFQADRVKSDFDNINKPANASDLEQRISEVPAQGIEALVRRATHPTDPLHCQAPRYQCLRRTLQR